MARSRALVLPLILILLCLSLDCEAKKKKPCKYNKKTYKAGEVIEKLEDNCVEFICSKKGKKTELTVMKDCVCGGDGPEPTDKPAPTEGPGGPDGAKCDCDYKDQFGGSHTMNKFPGPDPTECGQYHDYKLSDDDIDMILKTHNELRAKVANGKEKQGDPGPQPKAANMFELRWNCELAEVAQRWAEQCKLGHDKGDDRKICSQGYYVGQNAFMEWHYDAKPAWEKSVNNWYGEVKDMPKDLVKKFGSHPKGKVIGHYTQAVWGETFEVGCGGIHFPATLGSNTYKQSKVYVCNYGPGGNWLGSKIYEIGAPASKCPNGESKNYPGLCKPPK